MPPPRIGLAIIGAGRMGRNHAHLIAAGAPELRIVAIGDVDGAAARRLADEMGAAAAFADPVAALSAPGVDAVLIAVSSVHHREIVEAAAAAGRDILCEKPLALDLGDTDAIIAAVDRAGVRLQVGLMRRHDPDHVRARARIVAGELGRPLLFTSRQYDMDPPPPAILDPRSGGGIMLDMGIHEFDSARFLMGSEIVEVQATGSVQLFPELTAYGDVDTAVVSLRFATGAIGSIELSRRVAFGEDVRTEVHGTDGSAFIGGLPIASGSAFGRGGGIHWDATEPSSPRFAAAYTDQARAFGRAIQNDEPVSPSGADGRAAFLVAAAADRAIREGGPVRIDVAGAVREEARDEVTGL
jgi:predicted dehydrogenase